MREAACRLSAAEIRRLLAVLQEPVAQRGSRLHWSIWRRRHQAAAQRCHQARQHRLRGAEQPPSPPAQQRQVLPAPSAAQWEEILALVEQADATAHRRPLPQRPILEGILWMMERSARWQDIPAYFGAWKTIESRYRRWRACGTWAAILAILLPSTDPEPAPT